MVAVVDEEVGRPSLPGARQSRRRRGPNPAIDPCDSGAAAHHLVNRPRGIRRASALPCGLWHSRRVRGIHDPQSSTAWPAVRGFFRRHPDGDRGRRLVPDRPAGPGDVALHDHDRPEHALHRHGLHHGPGRRCDPQRNRNGDRNLHLHRDATLVAGAAGRVLPGRHVPPDRLLDTLHLHARFESICGCRHDRGGRGSHARHGLGQQSGQHPGHPEQQQFDPASEQQHLHALDERVVWVRRDHCRRHRRWRQRRARRDERHQQDRRLEPGPDALPRRCVRERHADGIRQLVREPER